MLRSAVHVCLALVVLTTLPHAAAQSPESAGTFLGKTVSWSDDKSQQNGPLVAFKVRSTGPALPPTAPAAELSNAGFELKADRIGVESDMSDLAVWAGAKASTPATVESSSFTNARVSGTEAREGQALFVFPTSPGSVKVHLDCGTSVASAVATVEAVSQLGARPTISTDVSQTMELAPCDGAEIVLSGDFLMVLWERDASLDADEGHADLQTGKHKQGILPDPLGVDGRPVVSRARQDYLTVSGGTLSIAAVDAQSPLIYATSLPIGGAKSMTLTDASGRLGALDVSGKSIYIEGAINGTLTRNGSGMSLNVLSGLRKVTVDGNGLQYQSTQAVPAGLGFPIEWALLGMIGLVAVPVVIAIPIVRRRRERPALAGRAEDLRNRGRADEGEPLARDWAAEEPDNPDALDCLADLSTDKGQLDLAWRHRQRVLQLVGQSPTHRWLRSENLLASAILARRIAHTGRTDDDWTRRALRCLNEAVQIQPDLRLEAERHPDLRAIVHELDEAGLDWVTP